MDKIRARFAPSPTGELHIGGARTALFNWLFVRRYGGKMILRIDDTDKQRSTEEYLDTIINSLTWLGLTWDEGPEKGGDFGPYMQSQRLDLYNKVLERLIADGKAYYCFCTTEELEQQKEKDQREGRPPRYTGLCRNLSYHEVEEKKAACANNYVIRLLVPEEGDTVVEDVIRGWVTFENKGLGDFIIRKSDGLPTYNFASAVDDNLMQVTHVIRAEEHLSNTPRQQIIQEQLGYNAPVYAHVPMILAPDHSKLSKRHGATSVQEYRDLGILPEALINYLALLGWSPGEDREIMDIEEMVERFSLEKVSKNPAIYDLQKLTWLNSHYLRSLDLERIKEEAIPFLLKHGHISMEDVSKKEKTIGKVIELVREKVRTLEEIAEASVYFFHDEFPYEEKGTEKHFRQEGARNLLEEISSCLTSIEPFQAEEIKEGLQVLSKQKDIPLKKINPLLRFAVTGQTMGPDLMNTLEVLGKEKILERLEKAASICSS